MLPGVIPAIDAHYAEMRRLEAMAMLLVRRAWSRVEPDRLFASWDRESARIVQPFTNLQLLAAVDGARSTGDALRAQGVKSRPEGLVVPEAFVGWASDGRPLESLLRTPVDVAWERLDAGLPPEQALDAGRVAAERIARTQIADTGRVAAGVDRVTRPRVGWVRRISPPTCRRCLILAGRFYRWSSGFDRHPNDDCVSVPTEQDRAGDLRTDPDAYFKSLSTEDQDKLLGKANAQAVRDGADLNQVVNAQRGMSTTADGVKITSEGATSRGLAGQRLGARRGRTATRLVPESIYKLASDRADALRLLHLHGYVL